MKFVKEEIGRLRSELAVINEELKALEEKYRISSKVFAEIMQERKELSYPKARNPMPWSGRPYSSKERDSRGGSRSSRNYATSYEVIAYECVSSHVINGIMSNACNFLGN